MLRHFHRKTQKVIRKDMLRRINWDLKSINSDLKKIIIKFN